MSSQNTEAQRHALYRAANREALRERHRRWREANPERWAQIRDASYERTRESRNAKQRAKNKTPERKAFMREYAPAHRAANKALYLSYAHARRARILRAGGIHTQEQWLAKLAEFGGLCAYCGGDERITRDHEIPLVRGGSNDINNIVPACGPCNSAKGSLTAEEFRSRRPIDERWERQLSEARAKRWASRSA